METRINKEEQLTFLLLLEWASPNGVSANMGGAITFLSSLFFWAGMSLEQFAFKYKMSYP